MERHKQLTSVGFDEVMVFPQGRFSTTAIKALRSCSYLAAVNSTPYPVDLKDNPLQLRDLLECAVTRFSGFPLFIRRYPVGVAEFAFDLFLGKAALLVEHHSYFRSGYSPLADFVQQLNAVERRLEWNSLSSICSRTSLKRRASSGEILVRFYTDRFYIHNDSNQSQRYVLLRCFAHDDQPARVLINGASVHYKGDNDDLIVPVELDAGQTAKIRIERPRPPVAEFRRSHEPVPWLQAFVRRRLSEFRDNHVDKSPHLNSVAARVRNRLAKMRCHDSTIGKS